MNSFRLNVLFAMAGNFSTTAALAVVIVTTARLGNPELVGRFSYALAICAPLFLLASLRLRDLSATESSGKYSTRDFLLVSLLTNSVAVLAVIPVCLLLGLDREMVFVAFLIGLWKTVGAFIDVILGHHQRSTHMIAVAKLQIIHGVATVITFVVTFALTRNLTLSVGLLVLVNLAVLLLVDFRSMDTEPGKSNGLKEGRSEFIRRIGKLAWTALPLGAGGAIFSLIMVIPRGLLEEYFSFEQVGIFASLAFFARLGTPVMAALGQTISSALAAAVHQQDSALFMRMLSRITLFSLLTGGILIALAGLAGQQVMVAVYGPEFIVSRTAAILIMVFATLDYASTLLTYGLIAARRLTSQMVVLTITILAVLVCGLILIPQHGVLGACISLVVASVVRVIGTGFVIFCIVMSFAKDDLPLSSIEQNDMNQAVSP